MADPLNLDLLDDLASFASPVVTKRLSTNPEPIPVPAEESAEGVCLFVDVTGFTPMTERLATRGAAGAEEMASILNTYFGPALLDDAFTTAEAALGAVRITGTPARKIVPPVVPPHLGTEAGAALREYVPKIAWRRLEGGQADWLGEFRRITSVFINLIGVDYTAADPAERLNDVLVPIQKVVHHYGGRVHQLIEADKGTVLLAAFGLPPAAHEDDPSRAVMAALEVENAVADQGLRSAIGITTGGIFFGPVGGLARRDYMVLGDVVNLAARLMQSAVDDILCDATTAEAFDRIEYDLLDPLVLKGLDTPVTPYRPHGDAPRTVRSRAESGPVFGRDSKISLLE